jgi:hypothetical protein
MTARVFQYFVDAKQFESNEEVVSGLAIKSAANVPPAYQLFLEEAGDTPDKPIADSESVNLGGTVKHFFAVPPATFGDR